MYNAHVHVLVVFEELARLNKDKNKYSTFPIAVEPAVM